MEVLSSYEALTDVHRLIIMFGLISGILFAFFAVGCFVEGENLKGLICLTVIAFILFFSITLYHYFSKNKMHEVLITDSNDFDFEKYEVIESRGRIFVIKELTR